MIHNDTKSRMGPALRRGGLAMGALIASTMLTPAAMAQDGTIRTVMHSSLRVMDPIETTAHITRNHAYMIYDVLIAQDENFDPQPQMAEFEVSDDELTYTFMLRDGLMFHDGEPVTPADVIASLERWMDKDSGGQLIAEVTESLEAEGDDTIVWSLSKPFGPFLETVSKQSAVPPFIMPEYLVEQMEAGEVEKHIGSGPFVFNHEEFSPGERVVYERNENYVPRDEPASWKAGGKVVNVDRVVWPSMPDAQTAINALAAGEIDYIESINTDLLPILEAEPDVTVEVRDPLGYQTMGRLNWMHPPFDDQRIRRAALLALSQEDVLATMMGDPQYYQLCGAVFGCGTPFEHEAGAESLLEGGDPEAAQKLLEEAGYDGTPIVLMAPTDVTTLKNQPVVAAQALRNAGFEVDMQPMDWQSVVNRRASMDSPQDGDGWNIFFTNWQLPEIANPLINPMLNARGGDGWFGWPDDPALMDLRQDYIAAQTAEEQVEIAHAIQEHALEVVNYIPLGQYFPVQARRNNIEGMLQSPVVVFWGVEKTDD